MGKVGIRHILPSLITFSALFFGLASILVTLEALGMDEPPLLARSAKLIILALVLDGLDGNLARWIKGSTAFGAELDTFVDFTAFALAPAALVYAILLQGESRLWGIVLPTAIVFSGAARMSRFRAADPLRGQGGFIGLPITVNSSWVAFVVMATGILKPGQAVLASGLTALLFQVPILVMITLQLTTIRFPKPSSKVRYFLPAVFAVFLLFVLSDRQAAWLSLTLAAGCLAFVISGPAIQKRSSRAGQETS